MPSNHQATCRIQSAALQNPAKDQPVSLSLTVSVEDDPGNSGIFLKAVGTQFSIHIPDVPQPISLITGGTLVVTLSQK